MKFLSMLATGGLLCAAAVAAELPEVTEEAVAELGVTQGTPQMNGFVFIEGRYLAPPYSVTRKGNGLFINRVQIEQPVPWSAFSLVPEAPKKALDADGDFEEVAPAAAAPVAPAEPAAPAAPKAVKSIDDLFGDDAAPAAAAPVPAPGAPKAAKSIDDLFADDDAPAPAAAAPAPAVPAAERAEGEAPAAAAVVAPQPAAQRSPEEVKRLKEELRANLDSLRKGYELALTRGEVFFFNQRTSRLNGNYGTARTLMGVLPKALRQAQSPLDLKQRLNQGGVYFIDLPICAALFKNKTTFPLLEERLKKIEEAEAFEAARRKPDPMR